MSEVADWLSGKVDYSVATYPYVKSRPYSLRRLRESADRAYFGYMNTYSDSEFELLFRNSGFTCLKKDAWRDQRLFLFAKSKKQEAEVKG
jgi:hypothetical protein